MAVFFAFDKFRSYLILSKTIVHTDHLALRHLFKKQDAKPRLIRWILLLQEFDIEIKDRKGTENVAADHLSRLKNNETSDDSEVDDNFPRETLMEINTKDEPWFADFANYLVVAIDYVSKWAEAQALPTNDARVVITFLKKLFCHFGMPKALISDRGTHFCNKIMEKTMKRYGVNHRFSTSYHPQTSGQVENTNRALKRILEKTIKDNPAIWSRKLDDALWAFRTAYKTPTGTTPYKLIYGKNCHLPFEIEHRAYWALKNCNPDLIAVGEKRMFQLHELDELRYQAYENSRLYKERTKVWHDKKLRMRKEFKQGNKVLLFHSKYKFKQPKLRSRWYSSLYNVENYDVCSRLAYNYAFLYAPRSKYGKFLDVIRAVRINVPLIDVLAGMPNYGKFLKELISNKHKIEQISAAFLSDESSAMIQNKVPPKLGDPGSFLIPCNFNKTFSCNALADLGASINLMPYSLYAKLSLENLKPTKMSVRLADRSFQYPVGIAENMLVEVGKFTFPADFVILEMEEDSKVPLILGRPFLHTADAVIRVKQKQLNLGVGTERMIFNIDSAMKHSYSNDDTCFSIDVIDEILEEDFDALLNEGSKILHSIEGTLLEEEIFAEFDEFMAMTVDENSDSESDTEDPPFEKITINIDYKIKTSIEEPPTDLKLKPLPDNLECVFLEEPSFLPVIISSQLSKEKKNKLISVLKKHKQAFAWKTTDIPGICPSFCKHKIQLLDDKKPVVQKQRRLNPNIQEVVKQEIMKLLDTSIIYPIADSPWVSPIHCVPKKGGITIVTNKNDELVLTRTITGWQICIDYRKPNEATAKDHFPLPFMDQMLERLAGNKYFCFLDSFSGYFQIPIDPNDHEKTAFTCPFGTYAYRRMPVGLCNAPATFQRCMLAIFHDMIEESVEVFMDDFFVFGNSFDTCLNILDKMLQRCKDAHLVLNWVKCHFMVKEGIVLRHKAMSKRARTGKGTRGQASSSQEPTIKDKVREFGVFDNDTHQGYYDTFSRRPIHPGSVID
ncbi:reverse transcriptase domain-containing protein [Tanacetum coccineum]